MPDPIEVPVVASPVAAAPAPVPTAVPAKAPFDQESDSTYLAYLFARGNVLAEFRDRWDLQFVRFLLAQASAGATLVPNTGTREAPNGTLADAIASAQIREH
jgi:hypothetical protein